jgi:hypothetical protein
LTGQQWKDVLLIGHDIEAYRNHVGNFTAWTADVKKYAWELKAPLKDPEARQILDQFEQGS